MKIIKNEVKVSAPEYPKTIKCRHCSSILEITESDVTQGTMVYSQREIDHNVKGVYCLCCNNFTAL